MGSIFKPTRGVVAARKPGRQAVRPKKRPVKHLQVLRKNRRSRARSATFSNTPDPSSA